MNPALSTSVSREGKGHDLMNSLPVSTRTIILSKLAVGYVMSLLGVVLALYTAVTRTDAVSKQIGEGNTPKQATKLGFKQTAKTVWIAHAAVLAVALILMIFSFTKSIGYCLACGVVASAFSVAIMRLFQACFTTISKKPSLFGKVK